MATIDELEQNAIAHKQLLEVLRLPNIEFYILQKWSFL